MDHEINKQLNLKLFFPFNKNNYHNILVFENFEHNKLKYIIDHKEELTPYFRKTVKIDSVFDRAKKLLKNAPNGHKQVIYTNYNQLIFLFDIFYPFFYQRIYPIGRFEASDISLQNMNREIRNTITHRLYDDIDQVNSHFIFLQYICEKFNIQIPYVKKYIEDRENILNELMKKNNFTRDVAKKKIISIMDGYRKEYNSIENKTDFVLNFFDEIQRIIKEISIQFPKTYQIIKSNKKIKNNILHLTEELPIKHTVLKLILYTCETYVMLGMCYFFKNILGNLDNIVLLFDGILLPKNKVNDQMLKQCEKFLFENFKIPVKLKKKKMTNILPILPKSPELMQ